MMAGKEYELNPVSHITTGAIGPAGKRVFYLQARSDAEVVTLIVEKAQVQSLAIGLEQYLQELRQRYPSLEEASPEFDESAMALEVPLDPAFRVAQLGLGYDESSERLVLVARELQVEGADPEEAGVARFWCTRSQLWAMCRWGIEVSARGRPICGNCGEPIDPEGHFCPKRNGHKH
jgi:uncharacterized repeat protein (TIGR03847 family)